MWNAFTVWQDIFFLSFNYFNIFFPLHSIDFTPYEPIFFLFLCFSLSSLFSSCRFHSLQFSFHFLSLLLPSLLCSASPRPPSSTSGGVN